MRNQAKTMQALLGVAAAAVMSCSQARADEASDQPVTECVGRSEFTLPGDAEAALYPLREVAKIAKPPVDFVQAAFQDGQIAGYTQWEYRGGLYVTRPAPSEQVKGLLHQFGELKQEARNYVAHHKVDDLHIPQSFQDLSPNASAQAWRRGTSYSATWDLSGIVLHWSSTYALDTAEPNARAYAAIAASRRRAPFELPTEAGICLPSLFIPDDGKTARFIASTYRLKQHPDITVWVQDRDAEGTTPKAKLGQMEQAAKDGDFFWTQNYQRRKAVRSLWSLPHPIDASGVIGMASLVELTRDDGAIDYGYFASIRGSPGSALGNAQVKMFVIRDAKTAIQRGMSPMDKATFLSLAETIQRSIRARKAASP
jgi:hypothetical protein